MINRFLRQLFEKQRDIESYDDCQLAVKYSFFEIYNEKVYDLLGKDSFKKLHLREGIKEKVYVEGLESKDANCMEDIIQDLNKSLSKRHSNQTSMNQTSSRSHFIITFDIESTYYMDYDE
jgi:hypothetical protein